MKNGRIIQDSYWSKADAFLLPITGLKEKRYDVKSYLFWNEYSIDNNQLMLCFDYNNYDEFLDYARKYVFPVLDKHGYLMETYDLPEVDGMAKTVMVLDISDWQMDINMFMEGKYSKLSSKLKMLICDFHTDEKERIDLHIYAAINPTKKGLAALRENGIEQSPLEWLAKYMEVPVEDLSKIGETASKFDKMSETLITDIGFIGHVDNGIAIDEKK